MNIEQTYENAITWTRNYFKDSNGKTAIIGISGGKDSTVTAKLLIDALGKENVIGVLMPQGVQHDIDVSKKVVEWLGIQSHEINIRDAVEALIAQPALTEKLRARQNKIVTSNLPARIRMSTLYAVSACYDGGRVVNTCNYSEDYVGYATKFGDAAGDFGLLQYLTVTEVKALGTFLQIPSEFVNKTPEDGLSGLTDEENLGFSYEQLDAFIANEEANPPLTDEQKEKIIALNKRNEHKLLPMPVFKMFKDC